MKDVLSTHMARVWDPYMRKNTKSILPCEYSGKRENIHRDPSIFTQWFVFSSPPLSSPMGQTNNWPQKTALKIAGYQMANEMAMRRHASRKEEIKLIFWLPSRILSQSLDLLSLSILSPSFPYVYFRVPLPYMPPPFPDPRPFIPPKTLCIFLCSPKVSTFFVFFQIMFNTRFLSLFLCLFSIPQIIYFTMESFIKMGYPLT